MPRDDAGARRASALGGRRADPAHQPRRGADRLRPRRRHHRREPVRGDVDHAQGCGGLAQGLGLSALLRHQLRVHRAGGGGGLPCGPVQHRRRGPGLYGGRGCRGRGARPRVPALAHRHSARHPRLHGGGRLLGLDSGRAAGQARQPHRDHHDHVQLHRREPRGLSHQLLVPPGGQDGGRKPRDHRRLHHELPRGGARILRRAHRLIAAQLLGLPRHRRGLRRVVPAVAHQARL